VTKGSQKQMRDQRVVCCTYYLESEIEPARAADALAQLRLQGRIARAKLLRRDLLARLPLLVPLDEQLDDCCGSVQNHPHRLV